MTILCGDCVQQMKTLADGSVNCCVTSPPYWGLRDYGVSGQLGLEKSPEEYVANMVAVFQEVNRVLRDDGTLWLNLGDSYNAAGREGHGSRNGFKQGTNRASAIGADACRPSDVGLKPKDLCGIPWRVAFALQADGWYLRSDIIWAKRNCMPESVVDRPTKSHEYIFLLSKSERYYYDADAIAEPAIGWKDSKFDDERDLAVRPDAGRKPRVEGKWSTEAKNAAARRMNENNAIARANGGQPDSPWGATRNKRDVWHIPTQPYKGAHFATFPEDLIVPCILAGCPEGGTVLDPFFGAGTVGVVCRKTNRKYIGIELNPEYVKIAQDRIDNLGGMIFDYNLSPA